MKDFTLAVGQWPVVSDREKNIECAREFLRLANERGANVALLPEMFQTPYQMELMAERAEPAEGESLTAIAALATELELFVVAGSIPEANDGAVCNSAYAFDPTGAAIGVHRKIHLFDVDVPPVVVHESEVFRPGERPLVFDTPWARVGVAVCYDLRFNDIFRFFEAQNVEVALLPAAFSKTTGSAHWHPLLRARAIDYQIYVAAACPAPTPGAPYQAFGHSLVVDPWGVILAEAGEEAATLTLELEAERLEKVRAQMPLRSQRRPDLYAGWK